MSLTGRKKSVFVTGATGFVGSALVPHMIDKGFHVVAAVLPGEDAGHLPSAVVRRTVEPLSDSSDYSESLKDIDIVIHLAARVHIMHETASEPLQEFRKVNVDGARRLAQQAARAGVKRFFFMSTIGVNGSTSGTVPFCESDTPRPHNPYSISKLEAETALKEVSAETGIELVIVRAPLVYGPSNPGNFLSFLHIVSKAVPLPFATIYNKRSLLYVGNLADAIFTCITQPAAGGNTYLVSDGDDVSIIELVRRTASALGVPTRLFAFPLFLIRLAGAITGKSSMVDSLTGSLMVDSTKIRRELGWHPPFTMEDGLKETADWYLRMGSQ